MKKFKRTISRIQAKRNIAAKKLAKQKVIDKQRKIYYEQDKEFYKQEFINFMENFILKNNVSELESNYIRNSYNDHLNESHDEFYKNILNKYEKEKLECFCKHTD